MSHDLSTKIRLVLEQLAVIREQFQPLVLMVQETRPGDIETAAACAMLHSFYTEIEKMFQLIARELDGNLPSSDSWNKELLLQVSKPTKSRPAVASEALVETLGEFLAFSSFVPRGFDRSHAMGQACSRDCEGRQHI